MSVAAMSYYNYYETDPLLPKDKPSPEIQGSRPQSINDVNESSYVIEEAGSPEVRPQQGSIRNVFAFAISVTALVLILGSLFDVFNGTWDWPPIPSIPRTIDQRVTKILTETPLIDGHNDLAILIRFLYNNHIYDEKFSTPFTEGGMLAHVDLPRLKEGRVGGAFWAAFVPCPANGSDFSDENYVSSVAFTYSQIDLLKRLQALYPTKFSPPVNSSNALAVFKSQNLIISPLAIEGLHQIGNSLSNLRAYHSLGVRYATLTHNCHNAYADAALTDLPSGGIGKSTPFWHGVSPAGQSLIHEMNRLGMIVDLSHVSHDTMVQVLGGHSTSSSKATDPWAGSLAPPIFSHSSAYALCPHPRNVRDDVLQLVKERNSIVMVNFSPDFISCVAAPQNKNGLPDFYPPNSTLEHVVCHIMYIGDLIGYEHVGLGSDFDGIPSTPRGLDDVSKFPDLVAEMLRRGVSDEQAAMVVGGNLLRVWAEVDAVAQALQKEGAVPQEDDLPDLKFGEMDQLMRAIM